MGTSKPKNKKLYLAILFAFVLVFLPTSQANALSFVELGFTAVANLIAYSAYILLILVGNLIVALVGALQWIINIPVYPTGGIAVIDESWKIMRDFANMFFILALIMMAFATIFDVIPGASKYGARSMFGKFIFTALLINFSLVLGVLVIQGAQILSNTFLTAIGDMAGRLGQALSPAKLFGVKSLSTTLDQKVVGSLTSIIFALVLASTFLFSLLTAAIFAFIRIPILWALLVVSPIAWILNIFPAGEGMFKKWWSTFIGWNMFLPIFLFFLYFGLYFLNQQDAVMTAIANQVKNQPLGETIPFSFQMLFMYIMAGIFLIGGTIVAMKASMFSGTGVVGVAQWSRGIAARRLGLTGAKQAYDEKKKEIMAGEGRLGRIFGGPPTGLEASRKLLGVRGGDYKTQKEFVDRAGKEYDIIQNQYDTGKIDVNDIVARASQGSATNPETYAYRKMAAKMGKLDDNIFAKTVNDLSQNPYAMQDFVKTAKEGKFSDVGADKILDFAARQGSFSNTGPGALPGRREAYRHIQSNAKIMANPKFGQTEFNQGIDLFGGHTTADGQSFLEDVGKTRPDLVIDYNMGNADVMRKINDRRREENKPEITRSEMFDGYIKDAKDIANLPKSVWIVPDFQRALERKLMFGSEKTQRNFRNRIIDNLRTALNGEDKKNILNTLRGARDTGQTQDNDILEEDDLDLDNEEDETPPTGGRGRPTSPPTEPTPPPTGGAPRTGRGSGNYPPGQAGFRPTAPPTPNPPVNPGNVVNLRDQNTVTSARPSQAPSQNSVEYLKSNLELFDRSNRLKAAEESLSQGKISQQEYATEKKMYQDIQDKVSDLDLRGGLPNNFRNLKTRQDFERKLKELQP